jgi:hypothetical protein
MRATERVRLAPSAIWSYDLPNLKPAYLARFLVLRFSTDLGGGADKFSLAPHRMPLRIHCSQARERSL